MPKKLKLNDSQKQNLLAIALDLQLSIKNAAWERSLTHPTRHMDVASFELDNWMDEAGIPRITYSEENGL